MEKIIITIKINGEIKIWVEGIKGRKCLDITKAFEEAVGEVTNRIFTSEYYQNDSIIKIDYLKEKR